jgi:CDP-diacylglycerol--serine O-phosphatidyltransferase
MAPALILFSLLKEVQYPPFLFEWKHYIPYLAFLIAIFSALRLAKFNVDERQANLFIGLPTPANALFWASVAVGFHPFVVSPAFNAVYLIALVVLFSGLLVAEIPMFSLKFKNLSWQDNKVRYVFLIASVPLLLVLKTGGLAAIISWYIILSLSTWKKIRES